MPGISTWSGRSISGRRAIRAIASYGGGFGVDCVVARILESKRDRPRRVVTSRQRGRVRHNSTTADYHRSTSGSRNGRACRTNYNHLTRIIILAHRVIVGISAIGGVPLIGTCYRPCGR